MSLLAFVIGTLILMFAGRYVTTPLTRMVLQRQGVLGGSVDNTYKIVDGCVMAVLGFVTGFVFRSPVIAIVISPNGWVGMIAFIAASFLGAQV